ncbi:MAG TPA: hypothetical protein VNA57_04075 [Acidimicrobiales bacterium]|nr:hypothetical protein [Acidimicrobiales bacterium]
MNARRMANALAAVTLAGSGTYLFVYLYRWEWNRAIIAGIFFLAAQMALSTAAVLGRLRSVEAAQRPGPDASPRVVAHLRETAPPPRDAFAWLRPQPDRMGVFVPILMGAGFVLSGLAWVVERLARATATPRLENRLALALGALALPPGHLLGRNQETGAEADLALLLGPAGRPLLP